MVRSIVPDESYFPVHAHRTNDANKLQATIVEGIQRSLERFAQKDPDGNWQENFKLVTENDGKAFSLDSFTQKDGSINLPSLKAAEKMRALYMMGRKISGAHSDLAKAVETPLEDKARGLV